MSSHLRRRNSCRCVALHYRYPVHLIVRGLKVIRPLSHYCPPCDYGSKFRLGHPNVECTLTAQRDSRLPRLTKAAAIPYPVARECPRR